jgi:hypothetical protein
MAVSHHTALLRGADVDYIILYLGCYAIRYRAIGSGSNSLYRGRKRAYVKIHGGQRTLIIFIIVAVLYFPLGVIFEISKKYK